MTALKPCPYCGSPATHCPPPPVTGEGIQWGGSVGCSALVGCYAPRFLYDPSDPPEAVIAAWNMRAAP